jgi:hypothetical protein
LISGTRAEETRNCRKGQPDVIDGLVLTLRKEKPQERPVATDRSIAAPISNIDD